MVRVRTGAITREEATSHEQVLMQKLGSSPKGLIPQAAAHELGARLVPANPDDPDNVIRLMDDVLSRSWWHVVLLFPGPLLARQLAQHPQPVSRHGRLAAPGPDHAVVLVDVIDETFVYLDPWFPLKFQPQQMSLPQFVQAWTGRYIPVGLRR